MYTPNQKSPISEQTLSVRIRLRMLCSSSPSFISPSPNPQVTLYVVEGVKTENLCIIFKKGKKAQTKRNNKIQVTK